VIQRCTKNNSTFVPHTRLSAAIGAVLAAAQMHGSAAAADLEEIQVTATRHSESISDVPYNISAVGGADIAAAGITDLQGLTHLIPGLVSPDLGPRGSSINSNLTIRGLNASSVHAETQQIAAPLVSTYVDETPLFANLKMTDVARVEVLRGPQGTLYGSGSVGGTVRIIHNEPDLTAREFDVSTRASHTENAANPSEAVDFVGNLPLSDSFAFRASGGYEKLAGFTDALSVAVLGPNAQPVLADPANPLTSPAVFAPKRGVDRSATWYARGALLWKPSDVLKFELTYQHQTDQSAGYSQARPGYRYGQTLYMDQPGSYKTDLGALEASYDLGFASLSSSSSFTSQTAVSQYDITGLIESLASIYDNYPRILSPILDHSTDKTATEEIRLASKDTGPWDWVVGSYYSHRSQTLSQVEPILGLASWSEIPGSGRPAGCTVLSADCPYPTFGDFIQFYNGGIRPSLNSYPDLDFTLNRSVTFKDFALFNETSYHFTEKWQATAGARLFWQSYQQDLAQTLPACGPFCSQSGTDPTGLVQDSNSKSFRNHIFKANTSYEIAPHTWIYATWSEGFRRGGVNALPTGNCFYCETTALLAYKPDEARNTEVGIKGLLGKAASYTFTLYHIDWKNPQIEASTVNGGFDFVTNGNTARSRGVETELTVPVSDSTRIQLGYSFTDAILTSGFTAGIVPDLVGVSGNRLPGVSRQQATVAIDTSVPISADREFHAHLDAAYRSDFWTSLPSSPTAANLPGFVLLNARAGLQFLQAWRVEAFLNNITNQEAATSVSTEPGLPHNRANFVGRPRTVGLELHYSFKDR
jgi:iron complex outermembrane receptor protein